MSNAEHTDDAFAGDPALIQHIDDRHKGTGFHTLYKISEGLRKFVDFVGRAGSWCVLPLIVFTCLDAVLRKTGAWQIDMAEFFNGTGFGWLFESTLLQELEWHFHTALFALVLGYGYIHNTHVRVDLVRETLSFRKKAWLEFLGCTFFMVPFTIIVFWFAVEYAYASWEISEISASQVGLSHRWVIKSILAIGIFVAMLAGIAVWLQTVICLFATEMKNTRFDLMTIDWPEDAGDKIEGKERIRLEDYQEDDARNIGTADNPTGS